MKNIILAILVLTSITSSAQVMTQNSIAEGFSLKAEVGYLSWSSETLSSGDALGGVEIGISPAYGFNEHIQAYASFSIAPKVNSANDFFEDYPYRIIALGARFVFGGTTSRLRPFVQVEAASHNIRFTDVQGFKGSFNGYFVGAGAGLSYYIRPNLALSATLKLDYGSFDNFQSGGQDLEVDHETGATRFLVGATYFFE